MKNTGFIFFFIAMFGIAGCQKELDEENIVRECGPTKITISQGGSQSDEITYTYNLDVAQPTRITHVISGTAVFTRTISPTYTADTIYLDRGGFIALDGSGRITHLSERNGTTSDDGDYYYTYNTSGALEQRVYDDGVNALERTTFSFAGSTITGYAQDINGNPGALKATFNYDPSVIIKDLAQYQLIEVLPELALYFPMIQIGRFPTSPFTSVQYALQVPGNTALTFISNYSGYTYVPDQGFISAYTTSLVIPGFPSAPVTYAFSYQCIP